MRISQTTVRTVADHAEKFTGGAFRMMGIGGDIGHGVRYLDGVEQLVWLGRNGGREAAAYYIGAMLGWARATGEEIPGDVRQYCQPIQDDYRDNGKAMTWQTQAESTAAYRASKLDLD